MNVSNIPPKRILVVDDEPMVCDAMKMMLNFDGHQVDTACNAQAALELFGQGRYDLVITDYLMPLMRGDALAAVIKARAPAQPIVLITAHADSLRAAGQPLGGVEFIISKPFLLEHLREAISKTLTSPLAGVTAAATHNWAPPP